MYGGGKLGPELASIYVEPVAERDGYELRNQLINAGLVPQQLQRQGQPGLANPNKL